jgi:hypothetical protein
VSVFFEIELVWDFELLALCASALRLKQIRRIARLFIQRGAKLVR